MRLIIMLMTVGILHVSAAGYGQRITLSEKNVSLEKLINKIRTQSGYDFLGDSKLILKAKPVNINVKDASIEEVLDICFEGQNLSYKLDNKIVVIKSKEKSAADVFVDAVRGMFLNIDVKGRIVDETGQPLSGASVLVKGTVKAVATDANGNFLLKNVDKNAILIIKFIGYAPKEVKATENMGNIQMEPDSQVLNEFIVVAYGTTKKGAFTGSAAKVSAEDLATRPVTNINSALAGSAPGIQVNAGTGQPGAAPSIRIRGIGSINASNDPLYIVDGIQYDGNIANLNTDDIENITVLKDAASSSLYGSSAANGVILITTKKGKSGKEQLSFRMMQGLVSRGVPEYDLVNAYQYYPLAWQAYRNSLVYPASASTPGLSLAAANAQATKDIKGLLMNNPFNVADNAIVGIDGLLNPDARLLYPDDLDWLKEVARTGNRSDYTMSLGGGTDKSDYYASLGYLNEKGYIIRSDYNRINGRINVNSRPMSWFKTGLNLSAALIKSNQADAGTSGSLVNPFNFSRGIGPIYPVYAHNPVTGDFLYDSRGDKVYDTGSLQGTSYGVPNRPSGASSGRHVLQETLLNSTIVKRNVLGGRTYGEITFLKDFKFTTNLGVDVTSYQFADYQNKLVGDGAPNGRARNTNTTTTSYTIEQLLNYNKSFGKHNVAVLLGHNNYAYNYKYMTGARNTQVVDDSKELVNFTTTTSLSSYTDNYHKEAYFTRVNYDYDGKYFLSGSFRRDGSSKWAPGRRWGSFYSVGGAWLINKEGFLADQTWLNSLKLRSSYGSVGNDGLTGYYIDREFYSLGYNNAVEPGILVGTLPNPTITWETNIQADAALEFAMFDNRLRGSFELFNRASDNLLFEVPLPLSSGYGIGGGTGVFAKNIGRMRNRGIEIQLGADIIKSKAFKWDMNINWTMVRNKITAMPEETPVIIDGTKQLAVGQSRYEFWLRQWAGVDPADGAGLYEINPLNLPSAADTRTINGQKYTSNSNNALYAYSGSALPKFDGSITNTFAYKDWSLSVQLNYGVGGKYYDGNYQGLMSYSSYGGSLHVDALKSWQQVGDPSGIPRLDVGRSSFYNATSTRFLIDASYLDMRAVTLGYNVPKPFIKKVGLSKLNVFASGENLFLVSKRKGLDPRQNFNGTNGNVYSPSRVVSLGINASF
ncbi:TonB-dependent receptor [Pedobacter nutrimenti]|nr:TonB-dependent receptor [Pedobacter nutrimenti]